MINSIILIWFFELFIIIITLSLCYISIIKSKTFEPLRAKHSDIEMAKTLFGLFWFISWSFTYRIFTPHPINFLPFGGCRLYGYWFALILGVGGFSGALGTKLTTMHVVFKRNHRPMIWYKIWYFWATPWFVYCLIAQIWSPNLTPDFVNGGCIAGEGSIYTHIPMLMVLINIFILLSMAFNIRKIRKEYQDFWITIVQLFTFLLGLIIFGIARFQLESEIRAVVLISIPTFIPFISTITSVLPDLIKSYSSDSENYRKLWLNGLNQTTILITGDSIGGYGDLMSHLKDSHTMNHLSKHASNIYAEENIEFLKALIQHQILPKNNLNDIETRKNKGLEIYSKYIVPGSLKEVNISHDTLTALKFFYDTNQNSFADSLIFEDARKEIVYLISTAVIPSFINSPDYTNYVNDINQEMVTQKTLKASNLL